MKPSGFLNFVKRENNSVTRVCLNLQASFFEAAKTYGVFFLTSIVEER